MKDFKVIVGAPGAENKNTAESPKASPGKKEKSKMDIGGILDSISDFLDSCESRFIEMEEKKGGRSLWAQALCGDPGGFFGQGSSRQRGVS